MNNAATAASTGTLLGDADPPPCSFINLPGNDRALLVGDHTGRAIPARLGRLGLAESDLERHIAYDMGTRELIGMLAERLGLAGLVNNYSRLVVDMNRRLDDPTAFPESSDGTEIPGNLNLTADQKEARVQALYQPYHSAIERWLGEVQLRNQVPALISIHSFTPELGGAARPWHIGILWDKDERIAGPLLHRLRSPGDIEVGDNLPYSGRHLADYTIDHHAEAAGLPCASIEIRQDLLQTRADTGRWARRLGDALEVVLADDSIHTHQTVAKTPPGSYANP